MAFLHHPEGRGVCSTARVHLPATFFFLDLEVNHIRECLSGTVKVIRPVVGVLSGGHGVLVSEKMSDCFKWNTGSDKSAGVVVSKAVGREWLDVSAFEDAVPSTAVEVQRFARHITRYDEWVSFDAR